jgi:hypothetical protein
MSGSSWALLPPEIRLQILEVALRQGGRGSYAAVCSEWKAFIEPQNFYQLELQVPCLEQLGHMITRTAAFVRQIRLNIELPRYSCRSCQWPESRSRKSQHSSIFRAAIQKLFTVLSAWKRTDPLVLELNTFSPSDSEHWFKNYCIGLDAQTEKGLETDVEVRDFFYFRLYYVPVGSHRMFYKRRCASYVVMSQNGCCGGGEPCRQLVMVCSLAIAVDEARGRHWPVSGAKETKCDAVWVRALSNATFNAAARQNKTHARQVKLLLCCLFWLGSCGGVVMLPY